MAVYKLFPVQDTTIYSEHALMNTGLDAILEVSKTPSFLYTSQSAADRAIIQFSTQDINSVVTNYVGTSSFSASLKLYLSEADTIPLNYSLEVHPVYEAWDMGSGRWGESPLNSTGASWTNKTAALAWTEGAWPADVTGSFIVGNTGGANWYTGSAATQSFGPYAEKDIDVDVTGIVVKYLSGSYVNNGFLIKNTDAVEFNDNSYYNLQYFSRDTNTIYPPTLEIKWDDSIYSPNNQINICQSGNINVSLQNNRYSFSEDSVSKVRLSVRDKFPARQFTTTSIYTVQKYLPSSSYWSLIDHKTEDVVIGFDENYTKMSADSTGNYFTLYMTGLEPSRYYRVLIKSVIGGETMIFDNDYIFKVE